MNGPHYGTPLAAFFATMSGQRLLFALSALTVVALKLGAPPLALTSSLVASMAGIEKAAGLQLRLIENLTERVVRLLDDASSRDLTDYLHRIQADQGALVQLTPEAMDLFQAGVEDNPNVVYQCTGSYAPNPGLLQWAKWLTPPWPELSFPIFALVHRITSFDNPIYPCSPPGTQADDALRRILGTAPPKSASDGIVPIRSQIYGKLIWAGLGDHLDVMGHFRGETARELHVDWLGSGAGFDAKRFDSLMDAIVTGMLYAER